MSAISHAARPLGRLAAWLTALALTSASIAIAPYDSTGATVELVPIAGGAAVASTTVTFPPDAVTVNLSIPPSIIAGLAPGASVSYLARATSNALTTGSTCNANVLSRQITFTKAGSATPVTVPTLGGLALVLLAFVVGVVAFRHGRASQAFGALLPLIAVAVFMLTGTRELNAQSSEPNTAYAGSPDDAVQSVRAVVDGAGVVTVTVGRANNCDVVPVAPAGSGFASLADITVGDNSGAFAIGPINGGGVVDPLGRLITYSASGLPNDSNGFLTANPATGLISGIYDALGIGGSLTPFMVTVSATNGVKTISKSFVLSIRNDG
jgi:hypothetical protein